MKEVKVLIGLDLSEMDMVLLQYLRIARSVFSISSLTFLHNVKASSHPGALHSLEERKKMTQEIREKLLKRIKSEKNIPEEVRIEVSFENFPELSFLEASKRLGINLTILGKKNSLEKKGELPQKLVRMLPHATLLVPQNFNPSLKSIVQAIDFSKYSPIIQKVGREMQRRYPSGKLLLQPLHVTKSALHYFSGPNRTQINQNLIQEQESMQKRWKRWFPEAENLEIISTVESSIGSCLSKYLVENKVGMVMVGITGSSALTGLYIGQVTNELIQLQGEYAVFVLKMSAI